MQALSVLEGVCPPPGSGWVKLCQGIASARISSSSKHLADKKKKKKPSRPRPLLPNWLPGGPRNRSPHDASWQPEWVSELGEIPRGETVLAKELEPPHARWGTTAGFWVLECSAGCPLAQQGQADWVCFLTFLLFLKKMYLFFYYFMSLCERGCVHICA